MVGLVGQTNFKSVEFAKLDPVLALKSFWKIKFRLVSCKSNFGPFKLIEQVKNRPSRLYRVRRTRWRYQKHDKAII